MSPLLAAVLSGLAAMFLWVGAVVLDRRQAFRGRKLPFAKRYLRAPGESLQRRLESRADDLMGEVLLVPASAFLFGLGVYAYVCGQQPAGRLFALLGAGLLVLLLLRFRNLLRRIADDRLGFLGERAVGEELNRLASEGWTVFHDVPFDDNPGAGPFNVDHVVVGPGGLHAIETKTRRKQHARGGHEVTFDGRFLHYPWGRELWGADNARFRAKALAAWLSKSLGRDIAATPVLALPGWFVRRTGPSDLRVVSGEELAGLFRGESKRPRLDNDTVRAIAALLEERCRDVTFQ